MTPERLARIQKVLSRRQPDLTVIADEVHKGRNLAAIVRSCDAVGVDKVHSIIPQEGYRPYRGTALGTQKWVDMELHPDINKPIQGFKSKGFQLVTTALSDTAVDYRDVDYTLPTAIILGSEREGVSSDALFMCDKLITIPMVGMVESLNVSVAAAIILFEAMAQRTKAGLYDECRLEKKRYDELFFRWAHPQVAKYCQQNDLPYPKVRDSDGEIDDPSAWYQSVRKADENDKNIEA